MYAQPVFRCEERETLLVAIETIGAVTLVTPTSGELAASLVPVVVDRGADEPVLLGHVARANPQWRDANLSEPALALATGPNTYVSPSWYLTKRQHGKAVPTWNYVHVQAHGRLEWVHDSGGKLDIVSRLTDLHETGRPEPWSVTDAPADYIESMLNGITGFRLHISRVEGSFKLSQNQPDENRQGVLAGLGASTDRRDLDVHDAMKAST